MTSRLDFRLAKLELVRGNGWREWRNVPMARWPDEALEGCLAECLEMQDASMVRGLTDEELRRLAEMPPTGLPL